MQTNGSNKKRAQTFLEYIAVITVITAIMIAMSTMVKRGVQGMVKAVADQIGNQQNADQRGGKDGYLVSMTARAQRDQITTTRERLGNIEYDYDRDFQAAQTRLISNLGFTKTE